MRTIPWPDGALLTLAFGVLCFAASTSNASIESCLAHPGASAAKVVKPAQRSNAACVRPAHHPTERRKP